MDQYLVASVSIQITDINKYILEGFGVQVDNHHIMWNPKVMNKYSEGASEIRTSVHRKTFHISIQFTDSYEIREEMDNWI